MTNTDVLWREIVDQPDVLRRLLTSGGDIVDAAYTLKQRGCEHVRFVAHGSSDNAATYGVYVLALLAGLSASRDSLSLPVYYHTPLRLDGTAVIAISRSGQTPDVVDYTRAARAAGATTLALTSHPDAPLAEAAELVLDLHAGAEHAPTATKTYTASLAALALLAAAFAEQLTPVASAIERVAASMPAAIAAHQRAAPDIAALLTEHERLFVTGRGLHYATARQIALNLTETAHVLAYPLSTTDLLHGPIAALQRPFPVWAIGGQDSTDTTVQDTLRRAGRAGAPTILTAPVAPCLTADHHLATPPAPTPLLAPLLAVLSGQVLAHAISHLRGPARVHRGAPGAGSTVPK